MESVGAWTILIALLFIGREQAVAVCSGDWKSYNNNCYLFQNQKVTWSHAESACVSTGGHLVSFADAAERDWVYQTGIQQVSGQKWWIGLNDLDNNGQWLWSDGISLSTNVLLWRNGAPTTNQEELCVTYEGGNGLYQNTMDDTSCNNLWYYVCKATQQSLEVCDTDRGFEAFESSCYLYVDQSMPWHDANDYCLTNFDGYLTSIVSATEETFVENYATQSAQDIWIGLSDTMTPGILTWSNGHDTLGYTNWNNDPPNIIHTGSTCTEMISLSGLWNTTRCGEDKKFVCKKGQKTTCPDGWIYGHGKCYEFHLNDDLFTTWTEARDYCYLRNARPITIQTQDEQDFLSAFYDQWKSDGILQMWIGASDLGHDDVLTWWDGTPITYSQWDGDYTKWLVSGVDDCSWVYTGKTTSNWEVGNCFQLQAFGCEISEGVSLSPIPKPLINYTCSDGWRVFEGKCYLFHDTKLSWDASRTFCQSAQQGYGDLVSIHNEAEQTFISGHLKGQSWSGLNDKLYEGAYQWSDGTPVDFYNWKFNQPESNGDCIRIVGIDSDGAWGTWNDRACTEEIYPICKKTAVNITPHYPPTVDPNPHESACGTNWLHYATDHRCYRIETKYARQWADARLQCQQEGGDLVSFNSPGEQAFIENYIIYMDAVALWTGGLDSYNGPDFFPDVIDAFDGGWRWIDETPFNYVNWFAGEPNGNLDENCLQIRADSSGMWSDVPCTNYYPFICEKDDPEHHEEEPDVDCTSEDCCFRHVGVEIGGWVLDKQLSSSSQWKDTSPADRGRLNTMDNHIGVLDVGPGLGAWIAAESDPAPWIQVDLLDFYEIRGVVSQGRNGLSQPENQNDWVKKYSIQYLINSAKNLYEDYTDIDGSITIFDANYDQDSQVTNVFPRPIVTSTIRVLPTSCRHKCAMRIELIGCLPTCISSLGISDDVVDNTYPVLDDSMFSASSFQTGFEPYHARLVYAGEGLENIQHYEMDSSALSYDTARAFCTQMGGDLCMSTEICPDGTPIYTGILDGDQWSPISDRYNDWVQVGNDPDGLAARLCQRHNDLYVPPNWGLVTGPCYPYNTTEDDCPHKGHVWCCAVNSKVWKPTTNSVQEYLQVDLGAVRKISGVLIQGNSELDEWVTDYKIAFSTDGNIFTNYKKTDGGDSAQKIFLHEYFYKKNVDRMFPGNFDRNTPVEGFLREAISAKHIRVLPQAWNTNIALKMDVIGCDVGDMASCTDQAMNYEKESFEVICPAGCDSITDKLWGTTVYTDDSYICTAAIHDGRIMADHGGVVTVKKVAGQDSYQSSTQHGITSKNYGPWPGSFTFQGDHLGCPTGWNGWKDWCYYLTRKSSKVDYEEANDRCQFYGGKLASIHSQAEQDFVTSLVFYGYGSIDDVWIGMNDFDVQNYYKWTDGSDVTYTRWDFNEPNGGEEHCVHMYKWSGLWNDKRCDAVMNYVCKMDKIPVNQAQVEVDGCQHGWLGNEASCYLIDVNPSVWVNAEDYCQSQGGHLVTINNYYEQMYLTSQAAQTSHPGDQENFYIGLSAYIDNSGTMTFKWSSGEPVTYTAWDKDEPYIVHQCVFPFQIEGVEYYDCIRDGPLYDRFGVAWCSADAIYDGHPVSCEGRENGQVGCIVMDKDTGYWSQANPVGCGSPEYRICETPRTGYTTPQIPTPPSPTGNCPTGWWGWANSTFCYQINEFSDVAQRLSWENSKLHCESMGANLVSIHSANEEQVIIDGMKGYDYIFWIGLKRQPDGQMGWSDKTPVSFTHWGSGEPNNHGGRENCVEGDYSPGTQLWNDNNCEGVRSWICKVERGKDLLDPITFPPPTLSPQICGSDKAWAAYTNSQGRQKCYYFASSPIQSWHSANTECQSYGGSLVTIATLDEQEFIIDYAHKSGVDNMWIGLVQDGMDGPYIWVDGVTPLTFENYLGGQPDNNNGHELCVEMLSASGLWRDANCGISNGFICQKDVGAQPASPTPAPVIHGGCPTGWIPYGSKCFLEVGFTDDTLRATWDDAEAYCESQNSFLASLTNPYYNAFLTSKLFVSPSNIWIGLNAKGTNRQFVWSSNEDVLFTNWLSGEPNNYEGAEECVEMSWSADSAGKWNDQRCSDVRPFYCSTMKNPAFPTSTDDAPDCPPNQNFVQWDTGCYKVYTDTNMYKNWHDARAACQNEGQVHGIKEDLSSVWNVYENHFLISLFWPQENVETFDTMWMGMYYNESQGEIVFMWSDHSPVAYSNWDTDQPVDTGEGTGCGVIDKYGKWRMMKTSGGSSCQSANLPYICKYETLEIPAQDPGVGTCEATWAGMGDYCYLVQTGANSADQRSWGDADAVCQSNMAYLASVHSDLENKAFISWTDQRHVWLGLKRNGWGGWEWSDSSGVDYTNWADGEPNDAGETYEGCVELWTNAKWNDAFCSENRGYICKKHKMYSTCTFPIDERQDCGYPGISEYECQQRLCCWDMAGTGPHMCYYSRSDAACLDKGGKCKDFEHNLCELGYEQFLCSGDGGQRCCFECAETDDTCNSQIQSWEQGDGACESGGYGTCQYNSNYCPSFVYETNKCGGPANRQCCVTNPPTKPPEEPLTTTTPHTTTPTNQPQTNPGETTTTPPSGVTTTTPPTTSTTDGVTENHIPNNGGGGLDAGGIAGIVIAVVFVVIAVGAGVMLYMRGNRDLSFAKFGSLSSSATGFDNPITYSNTKGMVDMENEYGEEDA